MLPPICAWSPIVTLGNQTLSLFSLFVKISLDQLGTQYNVFTPSLESTYSKFKPAYKRYFNQVKRSKELPLNREDCKKDLALMVLESTVASILLKLKLLGLFSLVTQTVLHKSCIQKVNYHCTPPSLAVWHWSRDSPPDVCKISTQRTLTGRKEMLWLDESNSELTWYQLNLWWQTLIQPNGV